MSIRSVDFHFDIMCPYAFQTSLWMRDVRTSSAWKSNGGFSVSKRSTGVRARNTLGSVNGPMGGP